MQHEAENYGARYLIQMKKSYNRIIRQENEKFHLHRRHSPRSAINYALSVSPVSFNKYCSARAQETRQ